MSEEWSERGRAVRDWMSRTPMAVQADSSIGAAVALMRTQEIRHLLVMEGDRLTGIVSTRDLGRLVGHPSPALLSAPVRGVMTEGPVTIAPEASITTAARVLLEMKIGALPVRDGDDIVGILTVADALESLLWFAEGPNGPSP